MAESMKGQKTRLVEKWALVIVVQGCRAFTRERGHLFSLAAAPQPNLLGLGEEFCLHRDKGVFTGRG